MGQTIRIYQLQLGEYVEVTESPTFPGWMLQSEIPAYIKQSQEEGRNKAMRAFRQWVRTQLRP